MLCYTYFYVLAALSFQTARMHDLESIMNIKKTISLWLPVILWAGLIFFVSSKPTKVVSGFIWWDFIIKKSAHVIEYAIFYFLLFRAINKLKLEIKPKKVNWILPFLLLLIYAASDEYHQSFIPGRTAKVRDVGFDLFGGFLSWWQIKKQLFIHNS